MVSSATCRIDHQPASDAAATRVNTRNRFLAENSMIRLIMRGPGALGYLLFTEILLGVLVELLLAGFGAKVIGLAFDLGFFGSLGRIDFHATDGVLTRSS